MIYDPSDGLQVLFSRLEKLRDSLEAIAEGKAIAPDIAEDLLQGLTPFTQLSECFNLSAFEQLILLLLLALELEQNFQPLCAKLQGDTQKPYVTLRLALTLLPGAQWSVLSPQNPLHHWQLIHCEAGRGLTDAPITIDRRILCYLLGQSALDTHLADRVTPMVAKSVETLPETYEAIAHKIVATWSEERQPMSLIALVGMDAIAHQTIAIAACDRLGFNLMRLPAGLLPSDLSEIKQFQRHWEREAILSNSVLMLEGNSTAPEPGGKSAIALFLETLTTPILFCSRDALPQLRRPIITLDISPLTHHEQTLLWKAALKKVGIGETIADLEAQIERLSNQFNLTPTAIRSVCHQLTLQTPVNQPLSAELIAGERTEPPTGESNTADISTQLWMLCCHQARPNLDDLAQRIEANATWEDLVLPNRQRQVLADIETHLKYRAQIYQQWGFATQGQRGLGISALFYGESGTGKTMAAEVLAQACRLDLYRIDLSSVVSKYIGETEKNLQRIFDAAEVGSVILLFDEADALFGKRTEVKDSHDRHANIEVSYLLQRMESYQGLAILTSNLKNNLDEAFLRRLRFMVPFPFPEAQARADIWRRIFPMQTPTQDLDYNHLGQLKIAGGNIRNIALNAAFLSAQSHQPVTMQHIYQAAQRDYLKLEKLLTTEELRGWELP